MDAQRTLANFKICRTTVTSQLVTRLGRWSSRPQASGLCQSSEIHARRNPEATAVLQVDQSHLEYHNLRMESRD